MNQYRLANPLGPEYALPPLTPLPEITNHVESASIGRAPEHDVPHSQAWLRRIVMADNTRYTAIIDEPRRPKSPIPIVMTTALGTHIEDAYNAGIRKVYADLGLTVIGIGPEENASRSLAETAYNMHLITGTHDDLNCYDAGGIFVTGDSRGAMAAAGVIAYAEQAKRSVIDGFTLDPCIARRIRYTNLKEIAQYLPYFPTEGLSLMHQVGRMSLQEMAGYMRRQKLSLGVAARTGIPLLSGQAGELARHCPPNQQLRIGLFLGSVANHREVLQEIYAGHPNVSIAEFKGTHMSLLDKTVRRTQVAYLADARDRHSAKAA